MSGIVVYKVLIYMNVIKYYLIFLLFCVMPGYAVGEQQKDVDYWTIEGMRSHEFSVGIFIFMLIGVAVFVGIIAVTVKKSLVQGGLKTGEKVMIICIILGVIGAVIMGAMQLLSGRLL